jgi:biotin carboxyl carrier protein
VSELPEVKTLARLLDLAGRYGLEELEVDEGGLRVHLRAAEPPEPGEEGVAAEGRYRLWPPPSWSTPQTSSEKPGRPENAQPLRAPLSGIFYRAQTPGAPPLVEVGDRVEEGQVLGLIEAMKVFSEVPTEIAGTVIELVVQNAAMVHHGDVLLYVVPD